MTEIFRIEYEQWVSRWEFPTSRFVRYDRTDEEWCMFFGIGTEWIYIEKVVVPRAYIKNINPDGTIELGAIPSPGITYKVG